MRVQYTPSNSFLTVLDGIKAARDRRKLAAAWEPGYVKERSGTANVSTVRLMTLINKKFPRWVFEGAFRDGFSISIDDEALGGVAGPIEQDVSEAKQIEELVHSFYPEAKVDTDHVDQYFYVNVSGVPLEDKVKAFKSLKAAWTEEEALGLVEDLVPGWWPQLSETVKHLPDGRYQIGPMDISLASKIYEDLDNRDGIMVESDQAFADTLENTASIYITIKGALKKPNWRSGIKKIQDKPIDHQEMGAEPDPTLMVRTPGVGTVTFDTTMGETMVSSLKAGSVKGAQYYIGTNRDGAFVLDDDIKDWKERQAKSKRFSGEREARAWIDQQNIQTMPNGASDAIEVATRAVKSIGRAEREGVEWNPKRQRITVSFNGDRFGGSSFYTPRQDEEDDDFPEFTGGDKLSKAIATAFSNPVGGVLWEADLANDEKGYFRILLTQAELKTNRASLVRSSLKAGLVELRYTRQEGGREAQHSTEFNSVEEAEAFIAERKKANKRVMTAPFENFKIIDLGDQSDRYSVWWVVDKGGDDYNEYSSDEGFASEEDAEAWAKKKRITRYEWGIKDSVAQRRERDQRRAEHDSRKAKEIAEAKALLKRHGVRGSLHVKAAEDCPFCKEPMFDFSCGCPGEKANAEKVRKMYGGQVYESGDSVVFLNGDGKEETGTIDESQDDGYVINEKFVNKQRVLRFVASFQPKGGVWYGDNSLTFGFKEDALAFAKEIFGPTMELIRGPFGADVRVDGANGGQWEMDRDDNGYELHFDGWAQPYQDKADTLAKALAEEFQRTRSRY